MTTLSGPVGLRNGIEPVRNAGIDQGKVIDLLWSIDPTNGGTKGIAPKPEILTPPRCSAELVAAITAFQEFWVAKGEFRRSDGVVDPAGRTLRGWQSASGFSSGPYSSVFALHLSLKALEAGFA